MKSKTLVRVLTLLLTVLMVFALVSCGDSGKKPSDTDSSGTGTVEEGRKYPNLPDDTFYKDYNFTFVSSSPNWGGGAYIPEDVMADAYNGDTINDATYDRNQALKAKYGFNIVNVSSLNCAEAVRKAVRTGDSTYDAVIEASMNISSLMFDNYLYNLYDLPNLDLSQEWWAQDSVQDLTFNNALYIVAGDMVKMSYCGSAVVYYNKTVAAEENVEDLYQCVRDGKWTFDKLLEIAIACSKDLNGDQTIDFTNDRVGLSFGNKNHMAFFYGAGQKIATIRGDQIDLTMRTERTNDVAQWLANVRARTDGVYVNDDSAPYADPAIHSFQQVRMNFMDNRVMFTIQTLNTASGEFAEMAEPGFGILPIPKYNEQQDEYYTFIPYDMHMLAVPNYVEDPARTGAILEAICAYSKYTTKKAAYDDILITRNTRSEENEEMIDLIQKHRIFDLGYIFNWGDCRTLLLSSVERGTNTFQSTYASKQNRISQEIQTTLETIDSSKF